MYQPSFAEFEKLAQKGKSDSGLSGNTGRCGNAGFRFNETPE